MPLPAGTLVRTSEGVVMPKNPAIRHSYSSCVALFVLALLGLGMLANPGVAFAKEKEADKKAAPKLATDEEAEEALDIFKERYKAKGLRGDDKLMERADAVARLAKVQHPDVVDALAKVTRGRDEDLRLAAAIYLGQMTAVPGLAGEELLKGLKRHRKDPVFALTALQAIGNLGYLGAGEQLDKLLRHNDYMYVKAAISTIGDTKDARRIWPLLKIVGVQRAADAGSSGDGEGGGDSGPIVVSEGYSWDGAEAVVDRGEADNTQENADAKKIAEAKIAANKAAAAGGATGTPGGGGGGSALGGGSRRGRGGTARSPKELFPPIIQALKKITGEDFGNSKDVAEWVRKNLDKLEKMAKECEEQEQAQKKLAKERK